MTEKMSPTPDARGIEPVLNPVAESTVEYNGVSYATTFPNGQIPLRPDSQPTSNLLSNISTRWDVQALQALPVGSYTIREVKKEVPEHLKAMFLDSEPRSLTIDIYEDGEGGKLVSANAIPGYNLHPGASNLMRALGFDVRESDHGPYIAGIPLPTTLVERAARVGVRVRLVDDHHISPEFYNPIIAAGEHPVALNNYGHDTADDHITARVLGGQPLTSMITRICRDWQGDPSHITHFADAFTNELRFSVAVTDEDSYATSVERAFTTLCGTAARVGGTEQEVRAVVMHALEQGKMYGLPVKDLIMERQES